MSKAHSIYMLHGRRFHQRRMAVRPCLQLIRTRIPVCGTMRSPHPLTRGRQAGGAVTPNLFFHPTRHRYCFILPAVRATAPVYHSHLITAKRYLQTSSNQENNDSFWNHPALRVVFTLSGIKNVHRAVSDILADRSISVLPPKPPHGLYSRSHEMKEAKKLLKKIRGKGTPVLYITGESGIGKTQLAREIALSFYSKRFLRRSAVFVGYLDATDEETFLNSYKRLVTELGYEYESDMGQSSNDQGETRRLQLQWLSLAVKRKFKQKKWLLIVDNLSRDLMYQGGGSRENSNNTYWPQPGDDEWGDGSVLVTTRDRQLINRSHPSVSELYLGVELSMKNAVAMLKSVSGVKKDTKGAEAVVYMLHANGRQIPLNIARTGAYIHAKRFHNPNYSFLDYLLDVRRGNQGDVEEAVKQIILEPKTRKVCVLLAACSTSPMPVSLVARTLGISPDSAVPHLQSMHHCVSLHLASSCTWRNERGLRQAAIDTVTLLEKAREVVCMLLLGDRNLNSTDMQERNKLLQHITDCVIAELKEVSSPTSLHSYQLRDLLLPHLKAVSQLPGTVTGFHFGADREKKVHSLLKGII